jgi:hypothetical protein
MWYIGEDAHCCLWKEGRDPLDFGWRHGIVSGSDGEAHRDVYVSE